MAQRTEYQISLEYWLRGYYACWQEHVDDLTQIDEQGMIAIFDKTYGHLFNEDGTAKA